jgi:hypothetical protein
MKQDFEKAGFFNQFDQIEQHEGGFVLANTPGPDGEKLFLTEEGLNNLLRREDLDLSNTSRSALRAGLAALQLVKTQHHAPLEVPEINAYDLTRDEQKLRNALASSFLISLQRSKALASPGDDLPERSGPDTHCAFR